MLDSLLQAAAPLMGAAAPLSPSFALAASAVVGAAEVAVPGQSGGIYIDLVQIQIWQALIAIAVGLGLSPAPWILGLAVGRIQFTKVADAAHARELSRVTEAHDRELAEQKRHYDALLALESARYSELSASNRANAEAVEKHRTRAEEVTNAALNMTEVIAANTHVIGQLNEVAREATEK